MKFAILALCLALAGCATSVQQLTFAPARPAIDPYFVEIGAHVDTNYFYLYLADITVRVGNQDGAATKAENKLKESAAKIGANRVILKHFQMDDFYYYLEGHAYFVNTNVRRFN
jgi:hypothetical protein